MTTMTSTTTIEEIRSKTSVTTTVTTICTCRTIVGSECCCGSSCTCAAEIRETVQPRVAPFVMQLYRLVSDTANKDIIEWLPGSNKMFVVNRVDEFSKQLLPKHYNHSNWSSFLRQLNNYGFKRATSDDIHDKWVFSHPSFIKQREELLSRVVRISTNTKQQATTIVTNNDQKKAKRCSKPDATDSPSSATKSTKISSDSVKQSTESISTSTDLKRLLSNDDDSTKEADNSLNNNNSASSLQLLHDKLDRCLQNQEQILKEQQRIVQIMTTHEEECALARGRHNSLTNADLSDWMSMQK